MCDCKCKNVCPVEDLTLLFNCVEAVKNIHNSNMPWAAKYWLLKREGGLADMIWLLIKVPIQQRANDEDSVKEFWENISKATHGI